VAYGNSIGYGKKLNNRVNPQPSFQLMEEGSTTRCEWALINFNA